MIRLVYLLAGSITAVLLVPQGMASTTLAGLPPQVGIYASVLPPVVYALLGTSCALFMGPIHGNISSLGGN